MRYRLRQMAALALLLLLGAGCSDSRTMAGDGDAGSLADAGFEACPGPCQVSLLAGQPGGQGAADGIKEKARMSFITGIVGEGKYLYLADASNSAIRQLDPDTGAVTTLAGTLGISHANPVDGQGTAASFALVWAAVIMGDSIYLSEMVLGEFQLRRVHLGTGQVVTVKDPKTGKPWLAPGPYKGIFGLAASKDKVYIGQECAIWEYDPKTGTFQLIAGSTTDCAIQDGTGTAARFLWIKGLAWAPPGTLYAGDMCMVRQVDVATHKVQILAGSAQYCGNADGKGAQAKLLHVWGLAVSGQSLFFSDYHYFFIPDKQTWPAHAPFFGLVRRIDLKTGQVTTLAGTLPKPAAQAGEADGPPLMARFIKPTGLWATNNEVYLGTRTTVRRIPLDGSAVTTVAGKKTGGLFPAPMGLVQSGAHLYTYLEVRGELVRVDPGTGTHEVMRSYDTQDFPVDICFGMAYLGGAIYCATFAGIWRQDLAAKTCGYIYKFPSGSAASPMDLIAGANRLYFLFQTGTGQGVTLNVMEVDVAKLPATTKVVLKTGITGSGGRIVHAAGKLYLSDGATLSRLNLSSGKLELVAGQKGTRGCQAGTGTAARFKLLAGMAYDPQGGRIFLGDRGCHRLSQLALASGKVTHLAGMEKNSEFKEGRGIAAGINSPGDMVYDAAKKALYVADRREGIIFKVTNP